MRGRGDRGQTTIELVLAMPLIALCLLALVQVGLLVRDQVVVVHAAREAVRTASVDPDPTSVRAAAIDGAPGLDASRLEVTVLRRGPVDGLVEVEVRYRAPTAVPLAGALISEPELVASAVMRVER